MRPEGCVQACGEGVCCELYALIVVEDRGPDLAERLAQNRKTERAIQGIGKLLGGHIAAAHVDYIDQIHEPAASTHR